MTGADTRSVATSSTFPAGLRKGPAAQSTVATSTTFPAGQLTQTVATSTTFAPGHLVTSSASFSALRGAATETSRDSAQSLPLGVSSSWGAGAWETSRETSTT